MPADLHCHTKISDGSTGLDELVAIAKRSTLSAIAVTDHDTFAGASRARVIGERQGVTVIPGVEMSCFDKARGRKVHILGYMSSRPDKLVGICKRTSDARKKAMQQMLARVMKKYPLTVEMVTKCATGSTNIFKQHIMNALMNCGYSTTAYGELYDELFAPGTGSCLVEVEYPDVYEVLDLLISAGAVTVLAHPFQYDSIELMPELCERGLHGVEAWCPSSSLEQSAYIERFAADNGLIATGGSDFHGMYTRQARTIGTYTTPDDMLDRLVTLGEKLNKNL